MENFVTLFITPAGRKRAEEHFDELEHIAQREIGLGDGNYINVYTSDAKIIAEVSDFFGVDLIEVSNGK
jgi:hypothetical protein